ncbi:MAG: hypothetical protein Q7S72_01210 [Candidatus Taylorbacteria bacterium]|nr:hypothetical protein [Candidatus Taylorbacteria bacterium]
MKLLFKFTILTLLFLTTTLAHAQLNMPIDGVTIQTDAEYPRPGQAIVVSVESYSFDLNSSSIIWTVAGKAQSQGIGLTKTTVTAPKLGAKLNVSANIKSGDGREVQKSITIQTSSVDIIWESSGYTPPFWRGKLPFSYQNTVKLIAIPHLSTDGVNEIDPKTLVYSWKLGGKYIDGGQGYGKQSVVITSGDIPKDLDVSVDVSSRDQTLHTFSSLTLIPSEPTLSFYEEDSLYGILFNKSLLDKVSLKNTEMKVLAIPFGFNLNNRDISYAWSINAIEQRDLIKNRSITIRTKGDTDGSSTIDLDIRNQDDILQGARGGFTVYFSKKQSPENSVTF